MRSTPVAAWLLVASLVPASASVAEPLGRLFFTPAQRHMLDAGKYSTPRKTEKPVPRTMQIDGIVTRSDAESTIWVNGKAYHDGSPEGVRVGTDPRTPETGSVRVPGKATARVKVGQQLELNSGRIQESFARTKRAQRDARPDAAETQAAPGTAQREAAPKAGAAAPTPSR
ncbi:MAG TPA: hypothetical protein VFV71_06040 [Burkholderiales bacterium]|nr:hypothetical protein [Burkholderiales bacterium]